MAPILCSNMSYLSRLGPVRNQGAQPRTIIASFEDCSIIMTSESPALSAGLGAKLRETVFILNDVRRKPNEDTQEST